MTLDRTVGSRVVIALFGLLAGLLLLSVVYTSDVRAQDLESKASGKNGPERVYALTGNGDLVLFDGDEPGNVKQRVSVKGLRGDDLVGIDFRPANGRLYGLGKDGNVYTIAAGTGQASRVSVLRTAGGREVTPRGQSFGIDFNPTVDRLRVVSDADQNLRVNVDTGETIVDGEMRYRGGGGSPSTTGVAYTNSRASAFGGSTEIYYVETDRDRLTEAADPNSGIMSGVGMLEVSAGSLAGFDIVTRDGANAAYAALQPGGSGSRFYNVSRSDGQARNIGAIGGGTADVEGIAIPIGQR